MTQRTRKIAFDIGANAGNTTRSLLKRGYSVIAVEANPMMAVALTERFKNDDVIVLNRAVTNKKGKIDFYVCETANSLSTCSVNWIVNSRFNNEKFSAPIKINCITLDELIDNYGYPEIIKIDVEGHEYEVISGLTKLDVGALIYFEFAEELFESTIKCVNHLKNIRYNMFSYTIRDADKTLPKQWDLWENIDLPDFIIPDKKMIWGMIYAKRI